MSYSEVVKIVNLEPIETGGEPLKYRIEILKKQSSGRFSPTLWRMETYRIQPTFPQNQDCPQESPCDEEIWVRDIVTIDIEHVEADNAESVLQTSLQLIREKFC